MICRTHWNRNGQNRVSSNSSGWRWRWRYADGRWQVDLPGGGDKWAAVVGGRCRSVLRLPQGRAASGQPWGRLAARSVSSGRPAAGTTNVAGVKRWRPCPEGARGDEPSRIDGACRARAGGGRRVTPGRTGRRGCSSRSRSSSDGRGFRPATPGTSTRWRSRRRPPPRRRNASRRGRRPADSRFASYCAAPDSGERAVSTSPAVHRRRERVEPCCQAVRTDTGGCPLSRVVYDYDGVFQGNGADFRPRPARQVARAKLPQAVHLDGLDALFSCGYGRAGICRPGS